MRKTINAITKLSDVNKILKLTAYYINMNIFVCRTNFEYYIQSCQLILIFVNTQIQSYAICFCVYMRTGA